MKRKLAWLVLVPAALFTVWMVFFTSTHLVRGLTNVALSPPWWRDISLPPVPLGAMQVYTGNPSSDDDGFRERYTKFVTDQAASMIHKFYRTKLPQRGWTYRCAVGAGDPTCGHSGQTEDTDMLDVYDRGTAGTANWQTLEVRTLLPDADGTRQVWVTEYGVGGSAFTLTTSEDMLVGNWRTTDAASGQDFILRFHQNRSMSLVLPNNNVGGGTYRNEGDGTLRLTFTESTTRRISEQGDGEYGLCTTAPSLLKSLCTVSDPSNAEPVSYPGPLSYPAPDTTIIVPPDPAYPGPPTPTFEPREAVSSHIDAVFAWALDGDTLTLTHASGLTQTFRRPVGN